MGREKIIKAIRSNKPAGRPLPVLPQKNEPDDPLTGRFIEKIERIGGRILEVESLPSLEEQLKVLFPEAGRTLATVPGLPIGDVEAASQNDVHQLADLDLAIVPGQLGVAENGAIWVTEADLRHRALAFIAQHLVIVLKKEKIVRTMHQAYQQIKIDDTGFGLFIAGPSKTADIEQSLVIGAHGARSLTVVLY